jgi:hypothetical protein
MLIQNRERASQIVDFSGLQFGTGYPTDLDGLMEWKNKGYVIIELKSHGVEMPFGQQLALERLCDDLSRTKETLLVLAEHKTKASEDIRAADCTVVQWRYCGEWYTGGFESVHNIVSEFLEYIELEDK